MSNAVLDLIYGSNSQPSVDNTSSNAVLDLIYGPSKGGSKGRPRTARDEYGNTEKAVASEKARIAQSMALADTSQTPIDLGNGATAIPDEGKPEEATAGGTYMGEISDEYASKHRAERLQKQNILQEQALGQLSATQYKNERNDRLRSKPTSMLERLANDIDDGFDDVTDYIFGKTKYKNKAEEEEAARADMNLEFDQDGNAMYSRQTTMNDKSLDSLTGELMQLEDDPDADQMIYYGRVDNPDGTHSYKIGIAGVDPHGRTKDEDRGKDITYLWAKRTKDAAKYEALFHGNRTLLKDRRNDIGTDVEEYGAGKTEIYNNDFLRLDGGVSLDKIKTLNRSSQGKLAELGVNVSGRYDSRGMESGYAALDKTKRLYGDNSKEAKELEYLMGNMERKGKRTRALIDAPMDLVSGVGSSVQQLAGSLGDTVLDAITPGNNSLLDNFKSMEQADKTWGYKGRKETEVLGRQAVREFKKGNYVGALMKGIQASPDTVAQSLPDMALMFTGMGTVAKATQAAAKLAQSKAITKALDAAKTAGKTGIQLEEVGKVAASSVATKKLMKEAMETATKKFDNSKFARYMDPRENIGLAAFAAKQTNNQIDERLENGEDNTNIAKVGAMFASNYVLGGIDKIALKQQLKPVFAEPIKKMMKSIPKEGMVAVAAKAAGVVAKLVKAGSIEAAQEYTQTYGETINAGLGTDKYGNNPFSEHFLDEATKGALLGFGAGGLMHGAAMGASSLGVTLDSRKKKAKAKDDKPLSGLGETAFSGASGFDTKQELTEKLDLDGIDTKESFDEHIDKALGVATNSSMESISSIVNNMIEIGKDKGYYTDDEVKVLEEKLYNKQNPHIQELKTIINNDANLNTDGAKDKFRAILQRSGAHMKEFTESINDQVEKGNLDGQKVVDFITEETLDPTFFSRHVMYRANISLLSKSIGLTSANTDTVIDEMIDNNNRNTKETEEAIEVLSKKFKEDPDGGMDFSDWDGNLNDIIANEDDQGRGVLSAIQRILAVVGKANESIKDDTVIPQIANYLSKLAKETTDTYKQPFIDSITGIEHFSLLKKVSYAFKEMSNDNIEAFLTYQQDLLDSPLLQSTYDPSNKKTTENVSYDIITSGKNYGKRSLQEYLHDALTALAIDDPVKSKAYLGNLIENLGYWVKTEGTLAETDKLAKTIEEEAKLKLELLNLLTHLRDGTNAKEPIDMQQVFDDIAPVAKTKKNGKEETSPNEYNDTLKEAIKNIINGNADLKKALKEDHNLDLKDC